MQELLDVWQRPERGVTDAGEPDGPGAEVRREAVPLIRYLWERVAVRTPEHGYVWSS